MKSITSFLISTAIFCSCFAGFSGQALAQGAGCTDPLANNYNAAATSNNGSCTYNSTAFTPPEKINPLNDTLIETSGLQWAGDGLWTFNDGGNAAAIYRMDTITNGILQRVYLDGITNVDWEDIAYDGTHFYIGDFGNNVTGGRRDLVIYKLAYTAIPPYTTNPVVHIPATLIERIEFTYSDQPQPAQASGSNNTNWDCEAMLVYNDTIHLFSKRWLDNTTTHYIIASTLPGTYTATALENLSTGYLVTAADKAQGQNLVALIGYQHSGFGNHYMHLLSGYSGSNFFSGNKRRIDLGSAAAMGQAEGITFRNSSYGYISNEKFVYSFVNVPAKLRSFQVKNFVSGLVNTYIFSGSGNWADAGNWRDMYFPAPPVSSPSQILIDPLPGGICQLSNNYVVPAGSVLKVSRGKQLLVQGNLTLQ